MNYPESVRFLYSLGNETKTIKLGLERMREVCAALGHPERHLRFIHVAGTNGKGSTCAMIERGLRAAGFTTGLYTSPHLVAPTERISISGEAVDETTFTRAFDELHTAVADFETHPTYFETVTAMALVIFRDARVDRVIWEVGLGGRLDATNVVTPELCVITPVSHDHQDYLGETLVAIAGEKAGIHKPGVPAVIAPQKPEARYSIESRAMEIGAPLRFVTETDPSFAPSLLGRHQIENARTAAAAMAALGLKQEFIERGIHDTQWPGRLELISQRPDVYIDGAHNVAGAQAVAEFIREKYPNQRLWLVFGVMRDKNIRAITEALFPLASELILTAPAIERAMPPQEIPAPEHAQIAATVPEALAIVKTAAPNDVVLITGSLFLVGEARALLLP